MSLPNVNLKDFELKPFDIANRIYESPVFSWGDILELPSNGSGHTVATLKTLRVRHTSQP